MGLIAVRESDITLYRLSKGQYDNEEGGQPVTPDPKKIKRFRNEAAFKAWMRKEPRSQDPGVAAVNTQGREGLET